jgi:hypothetical protein
MQIAGSDQERIGLKNIIHYKYHKLTNISKMGPTVASKIIQGFWRKCHVNI